MSNHSELVDRKNFRINVLEGALFIAGGSLLSPHTVLPALILRLGGSTVEVGLISVIAWFGLFLPQIFAARYTQSLEWKKPWSIRFGTIQRIAVLMISLVVLLFAEPLPVFARFSVLFFYGISQILLGIATPGWFDLFTKLTPLRKRGRLTGMKNSLAGVLAFLCGLFLTFLLGAFSFPWGYSIALGMAFAFQGASIVVQSRLIEEHPTETVQRYAFKEYIRHLPNIFKGNRNFRMFLVSTIVLVLASMPVGFFTTYALQHFRIEESAVGEFTMLIVGAQIVSALVNGFAADRFGNKIVLIYSAAATLCACLCALIAPTIGVFKVVFVFVGINLGSELMARYNIAVEYGPTQQRSVYIGLMNTILAPAYLVGLFGGVLAAVFGYQTLFIVGVFASFIGLMLTVFVVREPRIHYSAGALGSMQ